MQIMYKIYVTNICLGIINKMQNMCKIYVIYSIFLIRMFPCFAYFHVIPILSDKLQCLNVVLLKHFKTGPTFLVATKNNWFPILLQ